MFVIKEFLCVNILFVRLIFLFWRDIMKHLAQKLSRIFKTAMSLDKAKEVFELTSWPIEESELKKRYRLLALKHHPDRGGEKEKMQEIIGAAEVLFNELEKTGKTEKGTFSKLHSEVDKAMQEYKHIDHKDIEATAEILEMEEKFRKMKDDGHIDLAKLSHDGMAKVKIPLRSGGTLFLIVWKDKTSRYKKTEYYVEVESVSDDAPQDIKDKYPAGKRLSPADGLKYYERAEYFRNYETKIREKKKSIARQKTYEETFEIKEHGLGGMAYYNTEPSESIATDVLGYLLKTNVLKKISRGANAGKLKVEPNAISDLAKSKDSNAKFIAGVAMFMRGLVDKGVTSNMVAVMDAKIAAEEISSAIIFGSADGIKQYEKSQKLDHVPYREKDLKEYGGKTAEQIEKEAYEEEHNKVLDEKMREVHDRIEQLRRSSNTRFQYDANISASREERIANEENIMTEKAKQFAEFLAKSHAEYKKKSFEQSKEHREKGVYRYDDKGGHSDVFKQHHGEFLAKKEEVDKQSRIVMSRMNNYAQAIAKVMVEKQLMEPHPNMKYRSHDFSLLTNKLIKICSNF